MPRQSEEDDYYDNNSSSSADAISIAGLSLALSYENAAIDRLEKRLQESIVPEVKQKIKQHLELQGPGDVEQRLLVRRRQGNGDQPCARPRQALAGDHDENDGHDQRDPINRHQARDAPPDIAGQPRGVADVAMMHEQNDEAADHEEKVDAGVAELKQPPQFRGADGDVEVT